MCEKDKRFYAKQIESKGKICYATHKPAPVYLIHPSKKDRDA